MSRTLPLLLVASFALPAAAKPTSMPGFLRLDQLQEKMAEKLRSKREEEAFAAKPLQERWLLALRQGAKTFDGQKLLPENVVREIFEKWKDFQQKTPTEESLRIVSLLPETLSLVYLPSKLGPEGWTKTQRHKTSKILIDQLDSPFLHVRSAAIDALEGVYGTRLFYQPAEDIPKRQREKWIDGWRDYNDKQRGK